MAVFVIIDLRNVRLPEFPDAFQLRPRTGCGISLHLFGPHFKVNCIVNVMAILHYK